MGNEPRGPDRWEPDWMKTFRKIEDHIAKEVERYLHARRWMFFWMMMGSMLGYWIGFGSMELTKWLVGPR